MKKRIVIVGAGPAGCAAAILLQEAGHTVTILDRGVRPRLIVGESLVPAVISKLRILKLEDRVAKIGTYKPGASITMERDFDWSLVFQDEKSTLPTYAYNVPRTAFDALFQDRAKEADCVFRRERVSFKSDSSGNLLLSKPEDLTYDFLIDATGRARVGAAALRIGGRYGSRNDTALFSHFDKAVLPYGGSVQMTVFKEGWSWRIPLPGRVSVGFVINEEALESYGTTDAERFSALTRDVPIINDALIGAVQLEDVFRYQNYQLISDRMVGPNWAMVGDAAGFIDPVFSSGLALGLDGAFSLAAALIEDSQDALLRYENGYRRNLEVWQGLVDTFYDGRFFTLIRSGERLKRENSALLERLDSTRRVAAVLSGHGISDPGAVEKFYSLLELSQGFSAESGAHA